MYAINICKILIYKEIYEFILVDKKRIYYVNGFSRLFLLTLSPHELLYVRCTQPK